ncbi:alpha-galactosidase [Microcella alkaliphila]|uniref:alpha-galactosidase n=1 Tax=Microcella alkaliphila TaxID=279828 RepID=A0A0U5BDS2_9MICO|nr:alpha-galactosidase [Microcella alkaliphila]BAU32367.1 putative alpha-galactosidase [Microcella alkaliphila]
MPRLIHVGADLGDLDESALISLAAPAAIPPSSPDHAVVPSLIANRSEGFAGWPAAQLRRASAPASRFATRFATRAAQRDAATSIRVVVDAHDDDGAFATVEWMLALSNESIVTIQLTAAAHAQPVEVARLAATVPVPARASELLDFTGLWAYERRPQRTPARDGLMLREQRQGRPGHDSPFLTIAGTPGFGFRHGEVWALHHAWSGDSVTGLESLATGDRRLLAAELLEPGELVLAAGESYTAPETVIAYSASGLDGLSDRFHPYVRRLTPPAERPLVLNTWEAVYFDQSLERLTPLVEAAAEVGVERFVLDDGWFTGRTDDKRALGDWTVDESRWPDGLTPLIAEVTARGMEFGLWVEPEMVSPESELARAHPEWVLAGTAADDSGASVPPTWRWQHTLDLTSDGAADHVFAALDALLTEYPIRFLKWDHNRALHAGSAAAQTRALYALLDRLRAAHPDVAIESCASGGARIDLGIARRVHRFWTSDTNDALERQSIQRYTGILMPPELLGGHVGSGRAHITGRTHALSLRLITALFGHAGIEWDLTRATAEERAQVAEWAALYRAERALLHGGRTMRTDEAGDDRLVHAVVDTDADRALIALVQLTASPVATPPRLRLPGLGTDRVYRLEPVELGTPAHVVQDAPPAWWRAGSIELTGRTLAEFGVPVPLLAPEQAILLRATRT